MFILENIILVFEYNGKSMTSRTDSQILVKRQLLTKQCTVSMKRTLSLFAYIEMKIDLFDILSGS